MTSASYLYEYTWVYEYCEKCDLLLGIETWSTKYHLHLTIVLSIDIYYTLYIVTIHYI